MRQIPQGLVEELILCRVMSQNGCVVLPADFADIAEEGLLRSALQSLVKRQKLAQIGEMVFAKVRVNRITGCLMLDSDGGFDGVAKEALTRLGVAWEPGSAEYAYILGGRHIPTRCVVRVLNGDPPSLSFKGYRLYFEGGARGSELSEP